MSNSKHNLPIAPNILNREFAVSSPSKVWVSDITYILTDKCWLYLAGIKDLFNGDLVHHRRFKTRQPAIQEITEYNDLL